MASNPFRSSVYNIYLPLSDDDTYLIIQGCTGAVDRVSGAVSRYLQKQHENRVALSRATQERLVQRGYLTTRSPEEERSHVAAVARAIHRRHLRGVAFLLAPTLSCQLRCPYCYEAPFSHDGTQQAMTPERVGLAFAAIDAIVRDGKKRPPSDITLYGGEPLLAANHDIVRLIVHEAQKRKLAVKAISNGVDLPAYHDLLGQTSICDLQITIDGPEDIHNRRRVGKGGVPTFSKVCDGVQLALERGCHVVVRTNVDADNIGRLVELNDMYHARGWAQHPGFSAYANVTHDWLRSKTMTPLRFLETVESEFRNAERSRVISVDLGIDQTFAGLFRKKMPALRPYFCGANIGCCVLGPDGYVYACWDEIGREEGRIAAYDPELTWIPGRAEAWLDRRVDNIRECLACQYALLCGGGCGVQAKKSGGSLLHPFCHDFQETFKFLVPRIFEANQGMFLKDRPACS